MYFLLLLAPWHRASALQHDLAELGYASSWTADICMHADEDGGDGSAHLKCPITASGKFDFLDAAAGTPTLDAPRNAEAVVYLFDPVPSQPRTDRGHGQPRAPPVLA